MTTSLFKAEILVICRLSNRCVCLSYAFVELELLLRISGSTCRLGFDEKYAGALVACFLLYTCNRSMTNRSRCSIRLCDCFGDFHYSSYLNKIASYALRGFGVLGRSEERR